MMRLFKKPIITTVVVILAAGFASAQEAPQEVTEKASNVGKVLDELKSSRVLSEHSHDVNARKIDATELPAPTYAAIVLPVEALSVPAVAQNISLTVNDPETGVAIEGYDPVGYFTKGEPVKGSSDYTAEYQGATYYFASAENRDLFLSNTDKYAPAYGGYCTETLATGSLTPASPLNWTIHGDRLFLTRSKESTKSFREKRALSVASADKFWGQIDQSLHIPNAGSGETVQ